MTSFEQSLSNLAPLTFRGGGVFVFGDCLVRFRMWGSIPVLSTGSSSTSAPCGDSQNSLHTLPHVPREPKFLTRKNHCLRDSSLKKNLSHKWYAQYSFFLYWPYWLFVAARRFPSVVVTGGYPLVVLHGFSCPTACGIFLDQGLNLCPLHWQVDTYPLDHHGSPVCTI